MKRIIFLVAMILVKCNDPDQIFIVNETKSEVEFKLFFKKGAIDVRVALPINYENDYMDDERSRIKINRNLDMKSIVIQPNEKIEISCGTNFNTIPKCSYEEIEFYQLEFVEFTHLRLKKKVRFNLKNFYGLRNIVWVDTIYIKESMFE